MLSNDRWVTDSAGHVMADLGRCWVLVEQVAHAFRVYVFRSGDGEGWSEDLLASASEADVARAKATGERLAAVVLATLPPRELEDGRGVWGERRRSPHPFLSVQSAGASTTRSGEPARVAA
jgi:hypothetical protein